MPKPNTHPVFKDPSAQQADNELIFDGIPEDVIRQAEEATIADLTPEERKDWRRLIAENPFVLRFIVYRNIDSKSARRDMLIRWMQIEGPKYVDHQIGVDENKLEWLAKQNWQEGIQSILRELLKYFQQAIANYLASNPQERPPQKRPDGKGGETTIITIDRRPWFYAKQETWISKGGMRKHTKHYMYSLCKEFDDPGLLEELTSHLMERVMLSGEDTGQTSTEIYMIYIYDSKRKLIRSKYHKNPSPLSLSEKFKGLLDQIYQTHPEPSEEDPRRKGQIGDPESLQRKTYSEWMLERTLLKRTAPKWNGGTPAAAFLKGSLQRDFKDFRVDSPHSHTRWEEKDALGGQVGGRRGWEEIEERNKHLSNTAPFITGLKDHKISDALSFAATNDDGDPTDMFDLGESDDEDILRYELIDALEAFKEKESRTLPKSELTILNEFIKAYKEDRDFPSPAKLHEAVEKKTGKSYTEKGVYEARRRLRKKLEPMLLL